LFAIGCKYIFKVRRWFSLFIQIYYFELLFFSKKKNKLRYLDFRTNYGITLLNQAIAWNFTLTKYSLLFHSCSLATTYEISIDFFSYIISKMVHFIKFFILFIKYFHFFGKFLKSSLNIKKLFKCCKKCPFFYTKFSILYKKYKLHFNKIT
jgi:hypothetical protein